MVDSFATVAFETLRDLLVEKVKLLYGVSDEVKQVEKDLTTMHNLLMDADKWSSSGGESNCTLQSWIIELNNLASKAEHVLEKYAVEVTLKKEDGRKSLKKKLKRFLHIFCEWFSVYQVGKETEAIRSRLAVLTERLKSMSGGEGLSSNVADEDQRHLLRLEYEHEVEQHFVGMEKDIVRLVSMVKDEQRWISRVISIWGMGGIGKTTLARKIYHHEDVEHCFQARAWVCVTQRFQAETVLREILKQFILPENREEINSMEQRALVAKLHDFLVGKKCLIVIDDIWEIRHWDILNRAIPANCKVVLTTRNENIVPPECVYKLDFLTEDQGWELLNKIALLLRNDDTTVLETGLRSFEDIGRQMVQKCGRLPLAISIIGGILRQKQTLAEWEDVSGNIDSYLKNGEGVGNDTSVKQVLDLSYNTLPYYLKPCFLYMGCFPEDKEIIPGRLYLLWISEGLISSADKGRNETLIDVAQRYLTELAFRCMVQVQKREIRYTARKKFESCRLHDLIRDLCLSKADDKKFLKRIDFDRSPYNIPPSATSIRRLAICIDGTTISIDGIQELEDLRSLMVSQKYPFRVSKIHFQNGKIDFRKLKYLRILALEGCEFSKGGKLLGKVGKLIQLRYLSLAQSYVEELPQNVCDLPYLQTLNLQVLNVIKLPNAIYKMKRLRHLVLGEIEVIGGGKLTLDGLEELEILGWINSKSACIADIPKLTNLQELMVAVDDMDSLSLIAHHMSHNQSQLRETYLSVRLCDFNSEEGANVCRKILMSPALISLAAIDCEISCGFPCYQQGMCEKLVELSLIHSKIGGDAMETLGKYPMLESLFLDDIVLINTNMICGANSFPQLKFLCLCCLPNLKKWEVEERAMPKLTKLGLWRCDNLEAIPDGLKSISSLQEIDIHQVQRIQR